MKIGALIAEFNPFHTGHALLIDNIRRECDGVIAVMSGNFVQRGECAVYDKSERTAAALQSGVDLVIELPCAYVLSSAEGFARGAVDILEGTGLVDRLFFGSECGDIDALEEVAVLLNEESDLFRSALSEKLREGVPFPAARLYALEKITPHAKLLDMPNNILAVEYLRRLKKISSSIIPSTIRRIGSNYNDTHAAGSIASASALRAMLREGKSIEKYSVHTYRTAPVFMESFDVMLAARVKTASLDDLCRLPDCNGELAARIKAASAHNTFSEILDAAACKSYTQSRIRRILCNLLVSNTFSSLPSPDYIRPLGFNTTGSEILHKMKSTASLDITARGALLKDNPIFNLECRSTDIYNLARGIRGGMEYKLVPLLSS